MGEIFWRLQVRKKYWNYIVIKWKWSGQRSPSWEKQNAWINCSITLRCWEWEKGSHKRCHWERKRETLGNREIKTGNAETNKNDKSIVIGS